MAGRLNKMNPQGMSMVASSLAGVARMLPDSALPSAGDSGAPSVIDAVASYGAWVSSFYRIKGEACTMLQNNTKLAAEEFTAADASIDAAISREF